MHHNFLLILLFCCFVVSFDSFILLLHSAVTGRLSACHSTESLFYFDYGHNSLGSPGNSAVDQDSNEEGK